MYNSFFNFTEEPFNVTPDPRFLYLTPSHREALASMMYAVMERKGFISITGEVGTGKTTLIHTLLAKLDKQVKGVFIFHTHVSFEELLKSVLTELDIPIVDVGRASLLHALNDSLIRRLSQNENVALIIDEAQNLAKEVLEDLRQLSNLETPRSKLLQIVLVGQPELETKLDSPELRQLKERIGIRRRIEPLPAGECEKYIDHRLKQVGSNASKAFTKEALGLISGYSKGIPRRINTICGNAFLIGYGLSKKRIDGDIVREVLKDMGEASLPPGEVSQSPAEASPPPPQSDMFESESQEESQENEQAHSSSQSSSWDTARDNPSDSSPQSGSLPITQANLVDSSLQSSPWPAAHDDLDHSNLPEPGRLDRSENRKNRHARLIYVGLVLIAVLGLVYFLWGRFYSGEIKAPEPSPKASFIPAGPESSSKPPLAEAKAEAVRSPESGSQSSEIKSPPANVPSDAGLSNAKLPTAKLPSANLQVISARRKDSIFLLARKYYQASNQTLADLILEANPEITNIHVIGVNQEIRIPEISEESLIVQEPDNSYKIHLATFGKRRSLRVFERSSSLKGKELEFVPKKVAPDETWYRVLAGRFNSREECLKVIRSLKEKGLLPAFSS